MNKQIQMYKIKNDKSNIWDNSEEIHSRDYACWLVSLLFHNSGKCYKIGEYSKEKEQVK